MGKIATTAMLPDVGNTQDIELLIASFPSCIDGEQNRPSNETPDEANDGRKLDISEQEIRIERMMLEDVGIGQLVHAHDPIPKAGRRFRSAFPGTQRAEVRTRHVHSAIAATKNNETENHDDSNYQGRDQCGDQTTGRTGGIFGVIGLGIGVSSAYLLPSRDNSKGRKTYVVPSQQCMKALKANIADSHREGDRIRSQGT